MMKLKKYNLYQKSAGVLQGYYIGCVWATSYKEVGNTAIFMVHETCVATMNLVRVEECIIDD